MRDSIDLVIPAYNAAATIRKTVESIAEQCIPKRWLLNVYVADDGSTDESRVILDELANRHSFLRIVSAPSNQGRSAACNMGARAGTGSVLAFCDADCRYSQVNVLREFLAEIESGHDAVVGLVDIEGDGFWARYAKSVAAARARDHERRGLIAMTTANFAIRRSVFERLDGFSQTYRHYGFEDKDFLVRLERSGARVRVRSDLKVAHEEQSSWRSVLHKALLAGRHSAVHFRLAHPAHYARLPYARCDANSAPLAWLLRPLSRPLHLVTGKLAGWLLSIPALGFRTRRLVARIALCAAYFHGTASADADPERRANREQA